MSEGYLNHEDLDQRTRVEAYFSWKADGSPAGRDLEYWEEARKTIDIDSQYLAMSPELVNKSYEGGISAQPPKTMSI